MEDLPNMVIEEITLGLVWAVFYAWLRRTKLTLIMPNAKIIYHKV